MARRDEVARLFDLSRDVLLSTDSQQAIPQLATFVSRRFELDFVAICLPRLSEWEVFKAGPLGLEIDNLELTREFAGAAQSVEFDAKARTYTGHRAMNVGDHGCPSCRCGSIQRSACWRRPAERSNRVTRRTCRGGGHCD
jgi:hypothetical protein